MRGIELLVLVPVEPSRAPPATEQFAEARSDEAFGDAVLSADDHQRSTAIAELGADL